MSGVVVIIQARMGSTRLPGKVLQEVHGQTMLARTVRRVQRGRLVDAVAVATTTRRTDDVIVAEAAKLKVPVYRGSETDVLDRYVQAARQMAADTVVRITSDCPLIDPAVMDLVIATFFAANPPPDYASNTLERTYPRGLDVEIFNRAGIEQATQEARAAHEREHVTPYFYDNPGKFNLLSIRNPGDYSAYRWTVDTPEDLAFVRQVYTRIEKEIFGWQEVLALLEREPSLNDINRDVVQKPLKSEVRL